MAKAIRLEHETVDLTAYTVLKELELPHTPDGMLEGRDEQGNAVELRPNPHPTVTYRPGQTVHLAAEQAKEFLDAGKVAAPGSEVEARVSYRVVGSKESA